MKLKISAFVILAAIAAPAYGMQTLLTHPVIKLIMGLELEDAKFLILGMNNINATDMDGRTLLRHSALYNRPDIARHLIECDANIMAKDFLGWTPLHAAAHGGNLEIARLFIQYNADINAKNNIGFMPCDIAIQRDHVDLARLLARPRFHTLKTSLELQSRRVKPDFEDVIFAFNNNGG